MSEVKQELERIRNTRWTAGILRMAGKVMLYMVLSGFVSLIIAPALMLDSALLRIPLNLALLAGIVLLVYSDSGTRGQKEVAHSYTLARRQEKGAALSDEDIAACYHPMRGILAAALAAFPFFLAAIALAILAKPYVYTLQDLPTWLTAYLRREDIGSALRFYENLQGLQAADYLRLAVRLVIMPVSYMAGGFGDQAALLLDRLSPLLVLFIPGAYAYGYLRGPAIHRMVLKRNEEAKRLHKKKMARKKKRERQARARREPERLI